MYAKLVTAANTSPSLLARDVIRLCTSNAPSISLLSGFSNTSSVVIDDTPAGWTYVWSNVDGNTCANTTNASGVTPVSPADWWAMSAPCLGPVANNGTLKYVKLTCSGTTGGANSLSTNSNQGFSVTGCTLVSGNTVTNEGGRRQANSTNSILNNKLVIRGIDTFHLIATPRHFTIIQDGLLLTGVWEYNVTDVHTFYSDTAAPFIQIGFNSGTTAVTMQNDDCNTSATQTVWYANATAGSYTYNSYLFNITAPSTGVLQGTVSLGYASDSTIASNNGTNLLALQPYMWPGRKLSSIDANGDTKNLASPIFILGDAAGYPTLHVSSVCSMYYTAGSIGTSGDIITIENNDYTYFTFGPGNGLTTKLRSGGIAILTSATS